MRKLKVLTSCEEAEQTKQEVLSREKKRIQFELAILDYFKKEGENNA